MNLRFRSHSIACLVVLSLGGCASGKVAGDDAGGDGAVDAGPIGCTTAAECDDLVACTADSCDSATGTCASMPDDGQCEVSEMCDAERGCILRPPCEADSDCDDGVFCNGTETCDPATGCHAGEAPLCDDALGCTTDSCDPDAADGAGACVHAPDDTLCSNGVVCDGEETCAPDNELHDPNGCLAGTAPDCDDGISCTVDECSETAGGCESVPDATSCSDGVFCNGEEVCDPASGADDTGCAAGAAPDCDDGFACTTDSCDTSSDACLASPVDSSCDDGLVCSGTERCDPSTSTLATGCVSGTSIDCSDGLACTTDRCDEPGGMCTSLGSDADGDGFEAIGCGSGDDCDDLAGAVHPGASEVCDGIDNDCSGGADDGAGMQCRLGSAPTSCTTSCGTTGSQGCTSSCTRTPCVAATETCNGCDDDGDGIADDGLGCRLGTTNSCVTSCGTPGSQSCAADCSGFSACRAASETCNDCDDNGNGMVDEGFTCRRGTSRSCTTACGTTGSQVCALDCGGYGACVATEVCNGCDDDADGVADDGFACRQGQTVSCTTACGTAGTQQCNASCSGFASCSASMESCGNGCDDNGNGMVDEGCGPPNDRCTSPYPLVGASGTRTDTFTGANASVTDCANGAEIWYSFTISSRQIVYFDTFGSTFDTKISLRNGCSAASLQCEDDDCATTQEQLVRLLDPGTYYVAVHAFSAATTTGTVSLRWQRVRAGNGTHTRITGNGTYSGTTAGTGIVASSCAGGSGPENGHFFTLCPATSRTVTANTCTGTSFDSVLSIWRDGDVQVACNDDSCGLQSSTSGAVAGPGVFLIQVDGYSAAATGAYSLAVSGL